jgi:hypothetical protein
LLPHHFRGTEIKSQGAIMNKRAVRPELKANRTLTMECGTSLRRKALYLVAILMNRHPVNITP